MSPVSNSQITSPGFNSCPKAEQQITAAGKIEMKSCFIMPFGPDFTNAPGKLLVDFLLWCAVNRDSKKILLRVNFRYGFRGNCSVVAPAKILLTKKG